MSGPRFDVITLFPDQFPRLVAKDVNRIREGSEHWSQVFVKGPAAHRDDVLPLTSW